MCSSIRTKLPGWSRVGNVKKMKNGVILGKERIRIVEGCLDNGDPPNGVFLKLRNLNRLIGSI